MTKPTNLITHPATPTELNHLKDEYEWMGRKTHVEHSSEGDKLTILALPSNYKKKQAAKQKLTKNLRG
jgi:hypothetical protein